MAHRLHDASGSDNGNPPLNAQTGVEGFQSQRLPTGNGNDDIKPAPVTMFIRRLLASVPNHLPWHGIDSCFTYGLIQSWLGDSAYAFSAINVDAGYGFTNACIDQHPIGDVRVITAVFPNGANSVVTFKYAACYLQGELDALWGIDADPFRYFSA